MALFAASCAFFSAVAGSVPCSSIDSIPCTIASRTSAYGPMTAPEFATVTLPPESSS